MFDNNILLTQTERLTMNNRPKDPKTARNKNVLVIGGSGSGKTRFFVKPNLMQCVSKDYPTSFVITDPKGSLIGEVGQLLVRCGYRVKVLNTINFSKSMRYNPFRYIHSEKDILKLVNTLICNTKGEGEKSAEDFWIKSERLLYSALIGYIWYEAPDDEMNFTTLLEMINASEAREDDPEFQSPVDQMFERLEEKDPEHFAVRQYRKFLLSAGKTRSSILISCGARLAPFDIREVRELMEDDELELDTIGDQKTALFLIMSGTDTTFNFILAMVQSQLINLLCDRADDKYGGRLPVHVRLILDEFANIGQIPNFDKLIATIRSREISASIILQSQSQLKAIYKDAAEIISDNGLCHPRPAGKPYQDGGNVHRAELQHDRRHDEQCPVYGGIGSKGESRGTDFPFGCGRGSQGGGQKAQADPKDDAETKETVHPGAACRRQGGTEKEAPGAGKIKRNGGMRNVFHRGRRKPDLSVPQC